jgi:hypothetical protein
MSRTARESTQSSPPWARLAVTAAPLFASVSLSTPSSAQTTQTPIRLEYDAAASCPDRDTFVADLRARTDRFVLTLADPQAATYRVTLRSADESIGRVESREPSGAPIVQELHGATCGEVADALALVVALAIDPRAAGASAPTAVPPPPAPLASPSLAPSSPAPAPRELPSDRPAGLTSPASRWAISSTVGFGVSGPFLGPEAFLEAALVPAAADHGVSLLLDARVGGSFTWSSAGDSFGDVAQFTRPSGLLDLCPVRLASGRFAASACARGEAGALTASGGSPQRTRPFGAGGALLVARWALLDRVFVQLVGGAVAPFVHDRFILDGFAVYTVSPVEAQGSLAVGARFR